MDAITTSIQGRKRGINEKISMVEKTKEKGTEKVQIAFR